MITLKKINLSRNWFAPLLVGGLIVVLLWFPHVFSYEVGRKTGLIFLFITAFMEGLSGRKIMKSKIPDHFFRFFERYFLWLLLALLVLFTLTTLNEKFFQLNPGRFGIVTSFSIGAYMPHLDSGFYLQDVQMFLARGNFFGTGMYRPMAIFFMTMMYKMSGENLLGYYYLSAFLYTAALFFLCSTLARLFSKTLALVTGFILSMYFATYLGTFMTEVPGGILGMFAFSFLLFALFERKTKWFYIGLFFLGLALGVRTGSMFSLPLILLGGTFFLAKGKFGGRWWRITGAGLIFISLALAMPALQLNSMAKPIRSVSNFWTVFYQVQVNSPDWRQVFIDFPDHFSGLDKYEKMEKVKEIALDKFISRPGQFFENYFRIIGTSLKKPVPLLFPFKQGFEGLVPILVLILFFLTPGLYRKSSHEAILFAFLLIGALAHMLSSPFCQAGGLRPFAATISINALIFSMGLNNGLQFLKRIQIQRSRPYFGFRRSNDSGQNRTPPDLVPLPVKTGRTGHLLFAVLLGILLSFGPVLVDKMRNDVRLPLAPFSKELEADQGIFVLWPDASAYAQFLPKSGELISDPKVISGPKLKANNPLEIQFLDSFHFFNAVNYHPAHPKMAGHPYLMIPDSLFPARCDLSHKLFFLKGKLIPSRWQPVFRAEKITRIVDL